ncbi:hypothetical protein AB0L06_27805 [Spirillospora sp. NPDC052269]
MEELVLPNHGLQVVEDGPIRFVAEDPTENLIALGLGPRAVMDRSHQGLRNDHPADLDHSRPAHPITGSQVILAISSMID